MSIIKSDSLLSNIKNVSIRIDMRPNDGSNIFKSIFSNLQQKQRSIKFESLFDLDSNMHSIKDGNSLIDKLTGNSVKQSANQTHHYNWIVCKNAGLSEEQDNNSEEQQKQQIIKQQMQLEVEAQQVSNHLNDNINNHSHFISQLSFQHPNIQSNVQQPSEPKKLKNETKNIPKNYGKAIICYLQKYRHKVQKITEHFNIDYFALLQDMKKKKKSINTIADLRNLWSKYKYAKCMRVITNVFLRKHALSYIFDSRICTYSAHVKYRQRLVEAVASPDDFKHIKDY